MNTEEKYVTVPTWKSTKCMCNRCNHRPIKKWTYNRKKEKEPGVNVVQNISHINLTIDYYNIYEMCVAINIDGEKIVQ